MSLNLKSIIGLLVLLFVHTAMAVCQTPSIDTICIKAFDNEQLSGRVLVVKQGDILYNKGFGYANEEWQVEHTSTTKFKIGSCTKQFTAAIIMQLVEQNKLCLDSFVCSYLPEYPKDQGCKINLHHLLSHTSGIPDYFYLPKVQPLIFKENKPSEFIKTFWDLPLEFNPGAKSKYSNSGYFVLGCIIERVCGKSFETVLDESILQPLGMSNSGIDNQKAIYKEKAYGYLLAGGELSVAPYINSSGAYAAGAMYSTIEDLKLWCDALLNNKVLKPESLSKVVTPNNSKYGYGFGVLNLQTNNSKLKIIGHEGEIFGYRSLIHIFPEQQAFIIMLDNHNNRGLSKISKQIMNSIF